MNLLACYNETVFVQKNLPPYKEVHVMVLFCPGYVCFQTVLLRGCTSAENRLEFVSKSKKGSLSV